MRRYLFDVIAFMLIGLYSASPILMAATVSSGTWVVGKEPSRLVNGSPVLFRVTAPKSVRKLTGEWLGHDIEFSFDATHGTWFALAGGSQGTKPGSYLLQLRGEASNGSRKPQTVSFETKIAVARQRYPRVSLKVPGRYTAPSPEEQSEIEKDKQIKADAFKTLSADR